MFELQC